MDKTPHTSDLRETVKKVMKGHGLPVYHERERRHRVPVENLLSVMFVEKEAEGESGAIKCPTARQTRMTRPQSSRGTFVEIK